MQRSVIVTSEASASIAMVSETAESSDLARFQGPYATLLIAKAGVDVIKIAPPHSEALAPTRSAGQEHDLSDRNAKLDQTRELSRKVMAGEVISGLKGRRR